MSNSATISRPTPVADYSAMLQNIRRLIYLYLFLLIIEGALRKWIVPQFSNPLLLVRDPVVLVIYLLAWRAHIFPRNAFISSLATIGILSSIAPSVWAKVNRSLPVAEKSARPPLFHSFRGRSITSPLRPLSCSTAAFVVRVMPAGCFSAPVAAFSWQLLFREVVRWWFRFCSF